MTSIISRIAIGAGLAMIVTGCSEQVLPKGWAPRQHCENGHCWDIGATPDGDKWLAFRIGMTRADAIKAACSVSKKDRVTFDGGYPVGLLNGKCAVIDDLRDPSWMANNTMWSAKASGFWCLPFGASQTLYFDFKDGRLSRISAYCPTWDL